MISVSSFVARNFVLTDMHHLLSVYLSPCYTASGTWIATVIYTFILTGVAIYHSFKLEKQMPTASRSPVMRVFLKDGLGTSLVSSFVNA